MAWFSFDIQTISSIPSPPGLVIVILLASKSAPHVADDLIDLDEALAKLAKQDEPKANLVKLRYFAGLTIQQAAQALEISHATAERHWDYARSWLHTEIKQKRGFSSHQ